MLGGGGRWQCCTITLLHINKLNEKNGSAIFVSLGFSLLPEDLYSELIFFYNRTTLVCTSYLANIYIDKRKENINLQYFKEPMNMVH